MAGLSLLGASCFSYISCYCRYLPALKMSRACSSIQSQQTPTSSQHENLNANANVISQQKQALRSKVRTELKAMPPSLRKEQDCIIQKIVLESPWFKSSTSLCAYISCKSLREVDTSKILDEILNPCTDTVVQSRKKLYVPRIEDKKHHMRMLRITNKEDLIANSMNILEPSPLDGPGNEREDVMLANHPVDLLLLPGYAFDRSGKRLGRGGGYYDCFLAQYLELASSHNWQPPLLVSLAYSSQIVDENQIPVTPDDVPVDAVVSPAVISGFILCADQAASSTRRTYSDSISANDTFISSSR